jgi:putative tryptophan/tyrosine transport system substrate-binding protein
VILRRLLSVVALLVGLYVPASPLCAEAAAAPKRIGILYQDPGILSQIDTFRETLHGLGYVEGKTVAYAYRLAGDDLEGSARGLAQTGLDLIVTPGTPAALAAKRATATIPIVFYVADPVSTGLIASLARPGGNATGVASLAEETGAKRLELLKELLPRATRVALLVNPDNPANAAQMPAIKSAAHSLGLKVLVMNVQGPEDFKAAFSMMNRKHADALFILPDAILIAHQSQIVEHALKEKLPGIFSYRMFPDAGGLMSYGPSFAAIWRQCAVYADKILKGAKPSDLPVEQPTKFELVVNLKTAKALGITIPESILLRADEVIR